MKLIMGLEYRSKIRRNASCSPWQARATRSAELFIRDPANALGCPSRLNSWASRFIVFRCVSEPPLPKVSDFSTRQSRKARENAIARTFRIDRIVSKQQFGNRTSSDQLAIGDCQLIRQSVRPQWQPLINSMPST